MDGILTTIGATVIAIIGGLVAMAGVYFGGKKVAIEEAKAKQAKEAAKTAEAQTEIVKEASNAKANVNRLGTGDASKRLRDDWSRD